MDFIDRREFADLLADSRDCLIGVSGGMDSMSLLHWISMNKNSLELAKYNFRVMHVDHGISELSNNWAVFVADNCATYGIPCEIRQVSLDGLGNNLEYAARRARYNAFCESGADTLILAHHANDQCESFLLKLFRGSGVKGLKAMSPSSACWYDDNIKMIRPMLQITRGHIESWAEEHGVIGVDDPSNQDTKYDRNYIRNVIWPTIQDRFDIADINATRSIQHLGEAWELTVMLADIDIKSATMTDGSLDWTKIKDLGYLRIKNVLLRILDLENVYGFSVNHVEQFSQGLIDADLNSRNELSLRGFTIRKLGKRIMIDNTQKRAVA